MLTTKLSYNILILIIFNNFNFNFIKKFGYIIDLFIYRYNINLITNFNLKIIIIDGKNLRN